MNRPDHHNRLLDAVTTDFAVLRGHPQPFGVSILAGCVNFAVFSRHATELSLVLFRPGDLEPLIEFPLDPKLNRTGDVWHIALQGLVPGFEYGYRAARMGCNDSPVHRFDAEQVLLDPYARAVSGPSLWREATRKASQRGNWRGLLVDDAFDWEIRPTAQPPSRRLGDLRNARARLHPPYLSRRCSPGDLPRRNRKDPLLARTWHHRRGIAAGHRIRRSRQLP